MLTFEHECIFFNEHAFMPPTYTLEIKNQNIKCYLTERGSKNRHCLCQKDKYKSGFLNILDDK